jgi:hydrogenase 3 maturation protease
LSDILVKLQEYDQVLYVGVGNVLKRDDGVGVYMGDKLLESGVHALVVEQSIEKYVGKINSMPHDCVVILDATNFNKEPGYRELVLAHELHDQTSNTHNISLGRIAEFFEKPVFILGIQPANIRFGEELSPEVLLAADELITALTSSGRD